MVQNVGYMLDISNALYHIVAMAFGTERQEDRAITLLQERGMVRLSEFARANITATTVSRMEKRGRIVRLGRGLYQMSDPPLDVNHLLAEAAKLTPKGIICLASALAFHELTDTIPSRVWMAIGSKDRLPVVRDTPVQFVRFGVKVRTSGVEEHRIKGVPVRVYNPAKTIVDLFRYRRREGLRYRESPGLNLAIEGLRAALRQRKATPSDIARYATEAGVWKVVEPYLQAMIANV